LSVIDRRASISSHLPIGRLLSDKSILNGNYPPNFLTLLQHPSEFPLLVLTGCSIQLFDTGNAPFPDDDRSVASNKFNFDAVTRQNALFEYA
jgi:hypothetical protein